MHPSPVEAKVIEAWRDAAADLGFRLTAPFSGATASGTQIEALGLVHLFGRRIGTLIQVDGEPSADVERIADDDYTWSCLGRAYASYDRVAWIEMLEDWQFFGPESERPSWHSGAPWT